MVAGGGQNSNNTKKIELSFEIRFIDQRKAVTAIKCNKYRLLNISASHI